MLPQPLWAGENTAAARGRPEYLKTLSIVGIARSEVDELYYQFLVTPRSHPVRCNENEPPHTPHSAPHTHTREATDFGRNMIANSLTFIYYD